MRSRANLAVIACVTASAFLGNQAQAVTWLHHKLTATAEWAGGNPIGGFNSFTVTDTVNTGSPAPYIQSYGLPVRVNMAIDDNLIDNPPLSSDFVQQKFMFSYNANTAPGTDTSVHDFRARVTDEFVFSTFGCTLLSAGRVEQLTPYTTLMVEKGDYIGGAFNATGVVLDLLSQTTATIGLGTYRYMASFDSGFFPSSTSFGYSNNSGMFITNEAVPEPTTVAVLALGLLGIARRRPCSPLSRRNS